MSYLVSINSKHLQPNGLNNSFQYQLTSTAANLTDMEICVAGVTLYNSQFNVDAARYGNTSFKIAVPTAATTSTISVTLNDGYYSYADMNRMIQSACVNAGAYLIDSDGNRVFFIQIVENATFYSAQVDLSPVPSSLGTYTQPLTGLYSTAGTGLPTTTSVPTLTIDNAKFGKLIGFNAGTYPSASSSTAVSLLSNITPQVNPVSSYAIRCSLIDNVFTNPPDILCSFNSAGTTIGQLISYKPNEFIWQTVASGSFSTINLQIVDQDANPVKFNDPNILIELLFKSKEKKKD